MIYFVFGSNNESLQQNKNVNDRWKLQTLDTVVQHNWLTNVSL